MQLFNLTAKWKFSLKKLEIEWAKGQSRAEQDKDGWSDEGGEGTTAKQKQKQKLI